MTFYYSFLYSKEYKKDILYPVLCAVARRYGQAELYEGMVSDSEALIMPKGVSEMEIRVRQVNKLEIYVVYLSWLHSTMALFKKKKA